MRITDRLPEALATLDKSERAAISLGLVPELAQIHHLRGNLYFPLGRLDDCRREHELALDAARRIGSAELEARAIASVTSSSACSDDSRTFVASPLATTSSPETFLAAVVLTAAIIWWI
jgi:hypothetical protein